MPHWNHSTLVSGMQFLLRECKHSSSRLVVHLVFVTKYRRKIRKGSILDRMRESVLQNAKGMDFCLLELDGELDHARLLIEYPPKLSLSSLVNTLKGSTSRVLRKEYPELRKTPSLWSLSCFASSAGGAPIERLKDYIQNQETPP